MSWLTLFLAVPIVAFVTCWVLFIAVMKLRDRYNSTSCRPCRGVILGLALPIGTAAWMLDVALNYTLFQILGKTDRLTISSRLKDLRRTGATGWRRYVANFICERMLNPFDAGHC